MKDCFLRNLFLKLNQGRNTGMIIKIENLKIIKINTVEDLFYTNLFSKFCFIPIDLVQINGSLFKCI